MTKEDTTFVSVPEAGDNTVSAADMLKLLESFHLDTSDVALQALLEKAKDGQPVDRDTLMATVATLLSDDKEHLSELTGSIGDFEISFK
ncbi:hypothetical protein BDF21DRAFT_425485 [Thamnidium elegans]|uniref:Uncharacterized protein n=1 Tax=Thamnidium elegans TaxID=101142 RepID=A0A8H7SX25_9FUNG|nr:hypothetical protein INT48_004311 [Thamnidium elegans]KAI8068766.1 hypothetical protein BDF21DRAFT_425485 [Thamnidium elegans]